jgi:hypothetical protein
MKALSTVMNNYIINKTNTIYKNDTSVSEQGIASKVYERLYTGDSETMKEFLTFAMTNEKKGNPELFKNIITSAESAGAEIESTSTESTSQDKTIQDNKPKSIKTNVRLLPDGSGFVRGNEKFTWENIKNSKQENKLTADEKIEYDKWNANQNNINKEPIKQTTFKDIQASTDANTKKITEAFTDSEGNFKKMKTNKTNIRPFSKG